ncbi:cyanophycinase [Tamlana sp. I1]|uniref:cyanophycinase n=1 Tax=Tamlana sp. I1 TaxID=2762061 RepID=UPI00188F6F47|nr:cyanophycinase [Tamlana sp. I1]
MRTVLLLFFLCCFFIGCETKNDSKRDKVDIIAQQASNYAKGKLFIIGGGKRPKALVEKLMAVSELSKDDYMVILPMSSAEPDSAVFYASKQFLDFGVPSGKIKGFNFKKDDLHPQWIDSLKQAKLIYMTGGDQTKFMDIVLNTNVHEAINTAYHNGSTIAGTSAGAAVMSNKMITGNEYKHPEYTGDFRTIEAENIEITKGLGLLKNVIIDQHFIKRMRMNRLLSVALEHPKSMAVGIDESTAIIVENHSATVTGLSQVVVVENKASKVYQKNGLLGGDSLQVKVVLPGKTFQLPIQN